MPRICSSCRTAFEISGAQKKGIEETSPAIGRKTYEIPEPVDCPDCRQKRRLTFRNDKNYYKNTCHFCKKNVISIYSPDKPYPVACPDCYWSDQWDPLSYGAAFDFGKTFAEQFDALRHRIPRLAIFNTQSENSEYTVHSSKNKNCYMCASTVDSQDVYFSDWAINCRDCSDLLMCSNMELCSSCADSRGCFGSDWLRCCTNISDSVLCFDCQAGQKLVCCVSLKNKEHYILNKKASPEEIEETIARLKTDRKFFEEFRKKYGELNRKTPKREAWNVNTVDSSGNYLLNCKGADHCYHSTDLEDCTYVYDGIKSNDCHDVTRCSGAEFVYDTHAIIDLKASAFCNLTYQCDSLLYCDNCHAVSSCFGCFALKNAKYCILNKQFSKEKYEELVPKIIAHMQSTEEWGRFFPAEISSFGYNESKAQEWWPLSKSEAQKLGYKWTDYEQTLPTNLKSIEGAALPDNIAEVPDDILNYVISCEKTGKPFRLIPQELAYYRKRGLPPPRRYPKQRLLDLAELQNPRTLFERTCGKCGRKIQTTYGPERPEAIYCESCYLKEVF